MDKITQEQVDKIVGIEALNRATYFQLNFFVLGREPTHQAKLRRCMDELRSKKQQLDAMSLEIDDLKDRNELIHHEAGWKSVDDSAYEIKQKMADRKIVANNRAIEDITKRIKYLEEEMLFFVEAFQRLSEIEPLKNWDDIEVQTEYWNAKLAEDVNHRLLMHLPIDVEIVKTVLALPGESPVKKQMLTLLKKQAEKMVERRADVAT